MRKKVNSLLIGSFNNIDKLMTDKVDDFILIEEQPLPIKIGARTIYIGNLTLDNNYKWWKMYGELFANIGVKFVNFEMMNDTKEMYKNIMLHKKLYKGLIKIIKKTILKQQCYYLDKKTKERIDIKWTNCSYRYFKKNITMEKLLQIIYLTYLYNFDSEKKNLKILLEKTNSKNHITETYMYFWLQNLSGLTGKFQLSQLTNVDYWQEEDKQEVVSVKGKKGMKNGG